LSSAAADQDLLVENAVATLTGAVPTEGQPDARAVWQEQMQRAATEYDERTAEDLTRRLLDVLRRDHDDRKSLEALLVLGLAFGRVLERHNATFANEGRRLALLLERTNEIQRARALLEELAARMPADPNVERDLTSILRRTGGTGVLVEKYLRRAESAAAHGKPEDAIVWLQEIVLIDKNRRDVARMIRDLRYQEKERKALNARRLKITVLVVAVIAFAGAIWQREQRIAQEFQELPLAREGDLPALKSRLAGVDRLLDEEHGWIGMVAAVKEKGRLEREVELLEDQAQKAQHDIEVARAQREEEAEDARSRGLSFAERGQFEEALTDFRHALELSTPTWEHRARVQADVDAIEAWRKKGH
jgi:tetratricopeptide (TPR) repeat protein